MSNMMTPEMLKSLDAQTIYWDDLNMGDRFVTSGRTVTEADIVNFAGLSADYNSLHIDAEFASKSPHGQRLAHGLLVLAVVSGLTTRHPITKLMEKAIIGLAGLQCRWVRPTFIGDTLHVVVEVTTKDAGKKPGRGSLTLTRTAVNQRGETVMESDWKVVMAMRG